MISLRAKIGGYVVTVCTHNAPHLDEIWALLLAIKFARAEWVKQYCPNLVLELGIGDGPFNEHPDLAKGIKRKKEETCATLMAKSLGLGDHAVLKRIMAYAKAQDLEGEAVEDDFAVAIKSAHLINNANGTNDDESVVRWALIGLRALMAAEIVRHSFQRQLPPASAEATLTERDRIMGSPFRLATMFPIIRQYLGNVAQADAWEQFVCQLGVEGKTHFARALAEIKASAEIQTVAYGTERIKLCIINSDNPFIGRAFRSVQLGEQKADVLLQFKRNGQVFVAVSMKANLRLTHVVMLLRNSIIGAKIRRGLLPTTFVTDRANILCEGFLPGAEEAYYFPKARNIMNGAITNPDVPPLTGPGRILNQALVRKIVVRGIERELERVPQAKRQGDVPRGGGRVKGSKA